jgi:hypothetical protein
VTSGIPSWFSYTGVPGEVPDVDGTLFVERGGVVVTSIPAAARTTVRTFFTFADLARSSTENALVFVVPGSLMDGDVTMRVSASVAGLPGFGTDTPGTSGSRTVKTERRGKLLVQRLRMRLTNSAHPMAEPSPTDWDLACVGTQDRYPVGDANLWVLVPATGDVLSTDHFLGKNTGLLVDEEEGWEDALDDLDDYADRYNDFEMIFACIVPARSDFALNGIAHHAIDRPYPLSNDRRCFLFQAGKPSTFAHEMAHTLNVDHAPGTPKGDIDPRLPAVTEPGVVGWRRSDGKLMQPLSGELMSYSEPREDRWPSVALWNIILGQLI